MILCCLVGPRETETESKVSSDLLDAVSQDGICVCVCLCVCLCVCTCTCVCVCMCMCVCVLNVCADLTNCIGQAKQR